jgi:hypothetical protein
LQRQLLGAVHLAEPCGFSRNQQGHKHTDLDTETEKDTDGTDMDKDTDMDTDGNGHEHRTWSISISINKLMQQSLQHLLNGATESLAPNNGATDLQHYLLK